MSEMTETYDAIRRWLRHSAECGAATTAWVYKGEPRPDCSCGLDAAIASIKAAGQAGETPVQGWQPSPRDLQSLVDLWRSRKREGLLREDAELEITRCADELDALRAAPPRLSPERPVDTLTKTKT